MKTIQDDTIYEMEVKNSKFITLLFSVHNESEIKSILEKVRLRYPKATHYCYCYRLIDKQKANDDGEPSGTAGVPMLHILEQEDFVFALAVVVRYFGGIKLGSGGLIRAYSKAVREAVYCAKTVELVEGYRVRLCFSYDNQRQIDYLVRDFLVVDKSFKENITYILLIPKDSISILDSYHYDIIKEEYIEKTR